MRRKSCVLFSLEAYHPVGGQSFPVRELQLRGRSSQQTGILPCRHLVTFVLLSDFVQWIERKSGAPCAVTRSMEGLVYLCIHVSMGLADKMYRTLSFLFTFSRVSRAVHLAQNFVLFNTAIFRLF